MKKLSLALITLLLIVGTAYPLTMKDQNSKYITDKGAFGREVTFSKDTITKLIAWYKADLGVSYNASGLVDTWIDQSNSGNNVVQTTAGRLPTYNASTAGVLNGKPYVVFDGSNDVLFCNASDVVTSRSYIVVYQLVATPAAGSALGICALGEAIFYLETYAGLYRHVNVNPTSMAVSTDIKKHVLNGVFNARTSNTGRLDNGSFVTAENAGGNTVSFIALGNGGSTSTGRYSNVQIAEFMLFDKVLTTAEFDRANEYLNWKYKIY